jgi:hypothetical protein
MGRNIPTVGLTMTEAALRDRLATCLDLVEPGLTFRAVEFRLPNRYGASGKIDILATDRFSATVIIEIKKSNQTAREALHELHKYLGLIKLDHGLRDSQLRGILVSTEWNELVVPFSEFSRTAPWAIDGFRLIVAAEGHIDRAEKVVPVDAPVAIRLCPEHKIYCFQQRARRDDSLPVLTKLLVNYDLAEHLILELDCKARRPDGACDFALYLIVPEFDPEKRQRARTWLTNTRWKGDLDEPETYLEEQLVIAEVTDAFFDQCDDREIGYPEKLVTICQSWDVAAVVRGGPRLASTKVFSDEDILRWAQGLEGRNAHLFEMVATPRRRLAWSEAGENGDYTLIGNETWRVILRQYLEEVELNHPDATVTARIYNPCNLMFALYRLAKYGAGDALPTAELVVSTADDSPIRVVLGALVWNGRCVSKPVDVLPEGVPTLFDLYIAGAANGGPWEAEEHLVAQHGLEYVLVEGVPASDKMTWRQLVVGPGTLRRVEINERKLESFGRFCEAHQNYLQSLVNDFDSWAIFDI